MSSSAVNDPNALAWYGRFIVNWIAQDGQDAEDLTRQLVTSAYEYYQQQHRRFQDLAFSMDAIEHLNKACERLANRLFSDREVTEGKPAAFPIPFPFVQGEVTIHLTSQDKGPRSAFTIDLNSAEERVTHNVVGTSGTSSVSLYPHVTRQQRLNSLLNKFKEVVHEARTKATRQAVREDQSAPGLEELLLSRDRGHSAAEARIQLSQIIQKAGVRAFVEWLHDDPEFLKVAAGLLPQPQVNSMLQVMSEMSDAARRQAKSRALRKIRTAVEELELS